MERLESDSEWPGWADGVGGPARNSDIILWEGKVGRILVMWVDLYSSEIMECAQLFGELRPAERAADS